VEYRFKPNLRSVGKKFGKLVPALGATLRELAGEDARAIVKTLESGGTYSLQVADQTLELGAEDVLIETTSPEGFAVGESNGVLVALDTSLTPELVEEGMARELVRNIQDSRKSANFDISDRIVVYIGKAEGNAEIEKMLRTWGDYVRTETLADDILLMQPSEAAHTEALDLNGHEVAVGVVRRG
jgi:isoleucyl-tRNA synthetase